MGKIELAMMKFLILALALSTIATQANPVPQEFDETDDVSEIHDPAGYKQPENAQAAVNGANVHTHYSKTCNEPCPTFWANSHAKCAEGAEYKACTGLAWHTCVVANGEITQPLTTSTNAAVLQATHALAVTTSARLENAPITGQRHTPSAVLQAQSTMTVLLKHGWVAWLTTEEISLNTTISQSAAVMGRVAPNK